MCTKKARLHVGKTPEKNQDTGTMKNQKVKALVFQNQEISTRGYTRAIVHVSMHTCEHAYIYKYIYVRTHAYIRAHITKHMQIYTRTLDRLL